MISKKPLAQAISSMTDICIAGQVVLPRSACGGFWVAPGGQKIYALETAQKLAQNLFKARGPHLRKIRA